MTTSDDIEVKVTNRKSLLLKKLKQVEYFQLEPGLKTADADGGFYSLKVKKILTFAPGKLWFWLEPFMSRDITVCNSFKTWINHLGMVAYAITLMVLLSRNCFPDTEEGGGPACDDDDPKRNRRMCLLNWVLLDAKAEFRFLIAFILSGFVAFTVNAWAKRRTNYASLCGNARNTNILISSKLPLDVKDEKLMTTRRKMARWVMLAMELAMLKSRGHMDSEEGRDHLLAEELTTAAEWDRMVNGDRHSTVFWWIHLEATRLAREGVISENFAVEISEGASKMRAQANDLMSSLDRDLPIPYTILCGMLVQLNVLIMSTWKGVEWSIWLHSLGPKELLDQGRFWIDILVLLSWNVSYKALYDLNYLMQSPFGNRRIDVAHETIFAGIRKLSTALANGEDNLPPPDEDDDKKDDDSKKGD